ncbi:MAG: phosphotransferase [Lachnospiraceae bacterium]|nr:phosphotransferase [Lachnospiraceae bacterium]
MFKEIHNSSTWKIVEKISKGWSDDIKYKITTADDEILLLRISDISLFASKKKEYEIIKKYTKQGFSMSMPLDFGICNENQNVYMLLTWLEGMDLEEALAELDEEQQYQLGCEAGRILKQIHSTRLDEQDVPSKSKREKKLYQLAQYENSAFRVEGDVDAVKYVKEHIELIWKEEPVYMHGDFHPGNLIYLDDGSIGVIDFNRWEVGDPYEEFYKLESFAREISIPYCIGQIDAYFDWEIPYEFWQALAVYVAHASLYSIKWAEKFGQEEVDAMTARCMMAFEDYNNFRDVVPKWYKDKKSLKG